MVKIVVYRRIALDDLLALGGVAEAGDVAVTDRSAHGLTVVAGDVDLIITGKGLDYASGRPSTGTVRSLAVAVDGEKTYRLSKLDLPAKKVWKLLDGPDPLETTTRILGRDDALVGSADDDTLAGFGGPDLIRGRDGGDALLGGNGRDRLSGGSGDDRLEGGRGRDFVDGGSGTDTADYSVAIDELTIALGDAKNSKVLLGGRIEDKLEDVENIEGGTADDVLTGNRLSNAIGGGAGDDRLAGNQGDDTLAGGPGSDVLVGGAGVDRFVFDVPAGGDTDRIVDLSPGADLIVLASSAFSGLPTGSLAGDAFVVAPAATGVGHRVIYDQATGALLYDPDGAGGSSAAPIAMLPAGLGLVTTDFLIA